MLFGIGIGVALIASFTLGCGLGYDQAFFDHLDTEMGVSNIFGKSDMGQDEFEIKEKLRKEMKKYKKPHKIIQIWMKR